MDKFAGNMSAAFENELKKIAVAKFQKSAGLPTLLGAAVAGGAITEFLRRSNNDRRNGLAMRRQPQY